MAFSLLCVRLDILYLCLHAEKLTQKFTFDALAKATEDGHMLFYVPRNFQIDIVRQTMPNPDAPRFTTNFLPQPFEQTLGKNAFLLQCKYIYVMNLLFVL